MAFKILSRKELLNKIEEQQTLIVEQQSIINDLTAEISELKAQIAILEKNSSNSSKPPSSDIVKPPKSTKDKKSQRKIGGQFGHEKHESQLKAEDADQKVDCESTNCPHCGGESLAEAPQYDSDFLQYELLPNPVVLINYHKKGYFCPDCGKHHTAAVPDGLEGCGLTGPRLSAFIALLKGGCHASYSCVGELLGDVFDVKLGDGTIPKIIKRVTKSLGNSYTELLETLKKQPRLNIDETGFKENGKKRWIWVFRATLFTLFKISESRGSRVLEEVLTDEYEGIIGCDYFSAYRKFMGMAPVQVQFCLAHLIRELKFLKQKGEEGASLYADRLLDILRQIFKIHHNRGDTSDEETHQQLKTLKAEFLDSAKSCEEEEAGKLVRRFVKHGENYFLFLRSEIIEPTNNPAEQSIRFTVIDRKVTQGVRGNNGRSWCERIWTARATCAQQNRSCFQFLQETVTNYYAGKTTPSLIPS